MNIQSLFVLALLGEAIWETIKMTSKEGKVSIDRIGAIVIGLLLALSTKADLLELVGIPLVIPYVGQILTGLLISRGANFLHDLIQTMSNVRENSK